MSIEQTWQTESVDSDATLVLAAALGSKLRGGEVIELVSDLGGGKTTFVKGLAQGLGSAEVVTSPSFTVSNQYKGDDFTLYHFDFYRLQEPGLMRNELAEVIADSQSIVAIEWGEIMYDVLPTERLTIHMSVIDDTKRLLQWSYPDSLQYLVPRLSID